jgi:hypothetical protein
MKQLQEQLRWIDELSQMLAIRPTAALAGRAGKTLRSQAGAWEREVRKLYAASGDESSAFPRVFATLVVQRFSL